MKNNYQVIKKKIIDFYDLDIEPDIHFSSTVNFTCDFCGKERKETFKKFKNDYNNNIKNKKCYYCKKGIRDKEEIQKIKEYLLQNNAYKIVKENRDTVYFICSCGNKDKIEIRRLKYKEIPKCKKCNVQEGIKIAQENKRIKKEKNNCSFLSYNRNIFNKNNKYFCLICKTEIKIKKDDILENKIIQCKICSLRNKINELGFEYKIEEFNKALNNFSKLNKEKFKLPHENNIENFIYFHEENTLIKGKNLDFTLRLKKMLELPYICKNPLCNNFVSEINIEYCSKQCASDNTKKLKSMNIIKRIIKENNCELITKGIFDTHTDIKIKCKCNNVFHKVAHTIKRYDNNRLILGCRTCSLFNNFSQEVRYKDKATILYYIKMGEYYKVGICILNNPNNPIKDIKNRFNSKEYKDYNIKILDYIIFKDGFQAYKNEQRILYENADMLLINNNKILNISGKTEIFKEHIKYGIRNN